MRLHRTTQPIARAAKASATIGTTTNHPTKSHTSHMRVL